MTKPRAAVSASLAAKGHPAYWANEDEAAILSGMSPNAFKIWLRSKAALGFPKPDPNNDKRRIPDILAFWGLAPVESTRGIEDLETFPWQRA